MEQFKVDFDALDWETPLPGMRFKKFSRHGRQLRLLEFTKGFVEPDWCKKGHMGMVLKGKLKVDFKGRVVTFKAGDALYGAFPCRSVDTLAVIGSNGRAYSVAAAGLPGGRGDGVPVISPESTMTPAST